MSEDTRNCKRFGMLWKGIGLLSLSSSLGHATRFFIVLFFPSHLEIFH